MFQCYGMVLNHEEFVSFTSYNEEHLEWVSIIISMW